ncbi:MAG TPA: fatty acid--CoA ligase [Alphaproteobacteria bacterium]|nr:fatty acid--CoA ligase [Alphaproteobacteria bacterium]HAJ47357.1 fatty acid--CoA ligase [Alphaproteobacteria bacterium]
MTSPIAFPAMSIADAHNLLLTAPTSPFHIEEKAIRGITFKTWKLAPPTLAEVFALSGNFATRDFLVLDQDRVTFAAHAKAVAKLAAQLQADGIKKGDRVAIIMRNLPEWVVAFWASALVGAIVTPLNAWWTGHELEYGLSDSGSTFAFVDGERLERLKDHLSALPNLKKIYVTRASEPQTEARIAKLEDVIGIPNAWTHLPDAALPVVQMAPDDDCTIFYTSGTTGKPKGAVISHRNIVSNIFNALCAQARGFLRRGEIPPQPDPSAPQRGVLLSVPLFHATGCFAVMIPNVMGGGKLVMQRKWDADQALELIQREKVTNAGGVPTIAWQIIEHPRLQEFDLSSLDTISYGGAPSAPELVRRMKEKFPKLQVGQGWGMTETSATAVSNTREDYERKPSSCGVPAPSGEAKIMGPDGKELGLNEVGELWYKGPIVVRGYWNKPEATAETFVDGWVKTGDLARIDEEGFIYIVDRAKDMLIRGGENIYCVEVENALYDHPAVMDAAVVGKPHMTLGEEPVAVVHLKPGQHASEAELRAHVAAKIAAFKVPVQIQFMPETLPRNPNGKILKKDLRSLFGA